MDLRHPFSSPDPADDDAEPATPETVETSAGPKGTGLILEDAPDDAHGIMAGLPDDVYTPDDALPPVADLDPTAAFALSEALLDEATDAFGVMDTRAGVRALWLPAVVAEAGLRYALEPGWEGRGRPFAGPIEGVTDHHTASRAGSGNASSLRIVRDGRPDLPGPLSQIVLGRDGLVIIVASGRANHAGRGVWDGITDGNGRFIGIEAENDGRGEPWNDAQMDAYRRLVAAILRRIGKGAGRTMGHKEYARPLGRKPDPTFDMAAFRADVDRLLRGVVTPPDTVTPPQTGVERLVVDGRLGPSTFAALQRALIRSGCPLKVDGTCGPATSRCLQAALNHLSHYAGRGDIKIDGKNGPQTVKALQWRLGLPQDGTWGRATTAALQRRLNAGTTF